MLIACKWTSLYKKLDCNAKSEPPYLATTLIIIPTKNKIACLGNPTYD
jgi:hypothetical protein